MGAPGIGLPATCSDGGAAAFYHEGWICQSALPRYLANGDGTVTDNLTGLMWEMQTSNCTGEVTCWNNLYTWSASSQNPDGTLFTSFIAGLNGGDYYSPSDRLNVTYHPGTCFANHCDWRIPTIVELQSIIEFGGGCTSGKPCIDGAFGPTPAASFQSASSSAGSLTGVWNVNFYDGSLLVNPKTAGNIARAVRTSR